MDVARCWLLTTGCRVVSAAKATRAELDAAVLWTNEGSPRWEPIESAPWREGMETRRERMGKR